MPEYYFVTYEDRGKVVNGKKVPSIISNGILKDIHPVIWASKMPEEYREYFTKCLLFWEKIPEEIAIEADKLNYFMIEE